MMTRILIILFVLFLSSYSSFSQVDSSFKIKKKTFIPKSTSGKDFWVAFLKNRSGNSNNQNLDKDENIALTLIITSEEKNNTIKINNDSLKIQKEFFIDSVGYIEVNLNFKLQLCGIEGIYSQGIHISSDKNISVYVVNSKITSTDSYYAFCTESLGEKYHIFSYGHIWTDLNSPQFAVIATEDSTSVEITPTKNTKFIRQEKKLTINLMKGQVYHVNSSPVNAMNVNALNKDLTGSTVVANKKVAVISGHEGIKIPGNYGTTNFIWEQMVPDSSLGKYHIVPKFEKREDYFLRILSIESNNIIRINNKLDTLQKFIPKEYRLTTDAEIYSSFPVKVMQFISSHPVDQANAVGDPSMITIVPPKLYQKKYLIKTVKNFQLHVVSIIAKQKMKSKIYLDGIQLDKNLFRDIPNSDFAVARKVIVEGFHTFSSNEPFGLYVYGYDRTETEDQHDDAYSHIGGMNFATFIDAKDTIPPTLEFTAYSNDSLNKAFLIFSEKHDDDTGIKEITPFGNVGLKLNKVKMDDENKHVGFEIFPYDVNNPGKYVFEAMDKAGNKSYFTICYVYDINLKKFVFIRNDGKEINCQSAWEYQVGIFSLNNFNLYSMNFINSGELKSKGIFENSFGISSLFGLTFSKRFDRTFGITTRLNFLNYFGDMSSNDSSISKVRLDNGSLADFQERRIFELKGTQMHLDILGEYYFDNYIYLNTGLSFAIPLSKKIDAYREIVIPNNYIYANGLRKTKETMPSELSSINNLRIGLGLGAGYNYTFQYRYVIFGELRYNYYFTSIIDDGNWNLNQISFLLGFKYNIK
jgi:hypothetical protein